MSGEVGWDPPLQGKRGGGWAGRRRAAKPQPLLPFSLKVFSFLTKHCWVWEQWPNSRKACSGVTRELHVFTYSHAFPAIAKASLSISRKRWRVKCVYLLVTSTGPWRVNVGKVWLRIWGLWRRRLKIKVIIDQDAGDIRCVGCCLFHWVMRERIERLEIKMRNWRKRTLQHLEGWCSFVNCLGFISL